MSINDLIELIYKNNNEDMEQTIDDIDYLYSQVKLTPYALVKEMEEFALIKYRCPKCGEPLQTHNYEEDRGEFWGEPATETMNIVGCPNCGFVVE